MIILDIPRATPSRNATFHKHWRASHREKKLWMAEIYWAQMKGGYRDVSTPARARVTIERYGRQLEYDNFIGGLKSVLDSLRYAKLIADDSQQALDLVTRQFPGKPRTVITIEPLE